MACHAGSCHCGDVRIEVEAPADLIAYECDCSMCERTGFLHLIVPAPRFRLLTQADALAAYTFNTGVARHYFCRRCGCKPYYVPARIRTDSASTCVAWTRRRLPV